MDCLLLLRGINVGGNNRVPMADMRTYLSESGFEDTKSYINSGNLFFKSDLGISKINDKVSQILTDNYDFKIPFVVLSKDTFLNSLEQVPSWWGEDKTLRHNALFKLNDYDSDLDNWLTEHFTDYDQISINENVILWTSTLKINFSKSFYSKIMGTPLYKQTSARNFNTTNKLKNIFSER